MQSEEVSAESTKEGKYTNISTYIAEKAAARLLEVGPKAIQRHCQARNMESVPNENPLAIEGDDSRTSSKSREVRVVPHSHLQVRGGLVGDKRRLVLEHVMGSDRVGNREMATSVRRDQRIREPGEERLKGHQNGGRRIQTCH